MKIREKCAGRAGSTRGVAAVEFALVVPTALVLLGGVIDTGLLLWAKNRLAGAVSAASHYAVLAGPTVSTTNVSGILTGSSGLSGVSAPAPVLASNLCPSGTPATFTALTSGTTCPNGDLPASFLTITAKYTYNPVMPGYSKIVTTVLTETALVRLQ
jgi:Flp pilus assembly protein TadG